MKSLWWELDSKFWFMISYRQKSEKPFRQKSEKPFRFCIVCPFQNRESPGSSCNYLTIKKWCQFYKSKSASCKTEPASNWPTRQPTASCSQQGWTGKLFFHRAGRGGEGLGQKSTGQGGAGEGSKSAGRGTYCVYQLIEIIWCSKGNLSLHCIAFTQHS